MNKFLILLASVFTFAVSSAHAGFHDKVEERKADSSKVVSIKGGTSFEVQTDYDVTFDAVVRALKKADESIAVADRATGTIATEMTITGSYHQSGTRIIVTLIKEEGKTTTVKLAVSLQKRYKALTVEPWSDPVLEKTKTEEEASGLKAALGVK